MAPGEATVREMQDWMAEACGKTKASDMARALGLIALWRRPAEIAFFDAAEQGGGLALGE